MNDSFRIGDRWVTPSANEIDGWRVDSKAMEVLVELAAVAPDVVSTEKLLEKIWADVVVVENVVYQAIGQLRKTLGDDARAPRYIETVPRRGYRVVAPIEFEAQQPQENSAPKPSRPRHNLPAQLTSFIGREREMSQLGELIGAHRLVTLTGLGGCGKTRLALALANAILEDFPDGVRLVELAALTEPAQVEWSVAKVLELNVRAAPGESLRVRLLESVADKRCLVILDNCEHVIGACADFAEALLRHTHHLRILATSREALGIGGEHQWRVQSLATPDLRHVSPVDQFSEIESVRLFLERARLAQPDFALTAQNTPVVAQICSRLDGLPLAIELAAARVHTLAVEDIAARLPRSFALLTRGSRTASLRQRTLKATLDWSYALLEEPQRVLLSRLSVFANGFTLAAAEAVGAGDGLAAADIVDLLTRLVEQSMVEMVGAVGGAGRYRLLEPVRQYCQQRLDESGEETVILDRHRDYFISFASQMTRAPLLDVEQYIVEQDNFERALARCEQSNESLGLQLANSLTPIWPESSFLHSADDVSFENGRSTAQTLTPEPAESFRIGDRLVTSSANEIDGVRVDSKVMEVLVALAAAAPEVVPAQALLESLWPNVVVVDYPVVNRAIAQLRNVLGDDAQAPRYIETVPRRGYRLIAPVEPVEPVELTVESDGVSASESFVLPSPGPGPVSAVARGAARLRDWWFSTIWSNPSNEFPLRRSSRIPIGLPKRSWS